MKGFTAFLLFQIILIAAATALVAIFVVNAFGITNPAVIAGMTAGIGALIKAMTGM